MIRMKTVRHCPKSQVHPHHQGASDSHAQYKHGCHSNTKTRSTASVFAPTPSVPQLPPQTSGMIITRPHAMRTPSSRHQVVQLRSGKVTHRCSRCASCAPPPAPAPARPTENGTPKSSSDHAACRWRCESTAARTNRSQSAPVVALAAPTATPGSTPRLQAGPPLHQHQQYCSLQGRGQHREGHPARPPPCLRQPPLTAEADGWCLSRVSTGPRPQKYSCGSQRRPAW